MDISAIASELFIGYIALLLLTKLLGKTQITQISAFDFISALILGELVGNSLYDGKTGVKEVLLAIAIWGGLIYITEFLTQKSRKFRKLFEGTPSIVINKGRIEYKELKKNHLDLNQLQHLLRSKDVFSIRECEYALIETDGSISVLKKSPFEQVNRGDMNLPPQPIPLPVSLILDGKIAPLNLEIAEKDEEWLKQQIKTQGFNSIKDVLYAEWKEGETLLVQGYDDKQNVSSS